MTLTREQYSTNGTVKVVYTPKPDPLLYTYLMERRRALLTELAALDKLLGLPTERKQTVDKRE